MFVRISIAVSVSIAMAIVASPVLASTRYTDAIMASNPVAYYRLNEVSGSVAANSTANGTVLDGTYQNFSTTTPPATIGELGPRPGDPSSDATIRGLEPDNFAIQTAANSNVHVVIPDDNLIDFTGAFTLEAWVYRNPQTTQTQNNEGIIGKLIGSTNNRSYALYYDPRNTPGVGFVVNASADGTSGGNVDLRTTTNIPLGSISGWTHLAAVYEPNMRMSMYLNGVSIGEKTTGLPANDLYNSTAPLWIGRQFSATATNTSFEGKIDEVAIYGTALSPATILEHYYAGVRVPGDFNSDGNVDGDDFSAWQANFPKATAALLSEGDADGDGDVDGADFVVWQTNFPTPSASNATMIPEPSAIILAVIASFGLVWRRWSGANR
jgi:hypothetical protein